MLSSFWVFFNNDCIEFTSIPGCFSADANSALFERENIRYTGYFPWKRKFGIPIYEQRGTVYTWTRMKRNWTVNRVASLCHKDLLFRNWPINFPHQRSVTRQMFPYHNIINNLTNRFCIPRNLTTETKTLLLRSVHRNPRLCSLGGSHFKSVQNKD